MEFQTLKDTTSTPTILQYKTPRRQQKQQSVCYSIERNQISSQIKYIVISKLNTYI